MLGILVGIAIGAVVASVVFADYWSAYPKDLRPHFVGRQSCVECHSEQAATFAGSDHDRAMDHATDATVLGDFSDVEFEHHGVTSRMYRDGKKFMIHTEGETGELQDFEIKFVFGVDPLQQYMVEFDRPDDLADGELPRLQVLRISWDTENKKWFYLAPPDVQEKLAASDPLHWTGIAQRWQTMCADCHSTNLKTNFDTARGDYHTTFTDIDVSCESCHGPGSLHVEMANSQSIFWDRHHGLGLATLKGDDPQPQLQTCAPCHSRRGLLDDQFLAGDRFSEHFELERLTPMTYHADGQIKDEVYVYGSFIQSKMYHKGIRCTDCHDPHSLELKHPGNQTCTSCHQHSAGKYDTPSHHHHAVGTAGAMCVNCHMPHTTYMALDDRRDHSLRVPRPDLSVRLGTPNACSSCHIGDNADKIDAERTSDLSQYADWITAAENGDTAIAQHIQSIDQWCDDACQKWYGADRKTPPHFAETFAAFRAGEAGAASKLLALATADDAIAPAIARASAWDELTLSAEANRGNRQAKSILQDAGADPMVRAAAVRNMAAADPETIRRWVLPQLADESKLVRIAAVRTVLGAGLYGSLSGDKQKLVDRGIDEIRESLDVTADRSGSHMGWAMICESAGRFDEAIAAYETAIQVEPGTAGPRTNYAHLLDQLAAGPRQSDSESLSAKALQLRQQELPLLKRDADLVPDLAEVQYRYGLALYLAGRHAEALDQLRHTVGLAPTQQIYQQAYTALLQQLGESEQAARP